MPSACKKRRLDPPSESLPTNAAVSETAITTAAAAALAEIEKDVPMVDTDASMALPSEVWAAVLEYLPFHDMVSFSTCSQWSMKALKDVRTLYIFNSSELTVPLAKRVQNAERVFVCCLLKAADPTSHTPVLFRFNQSSVLEYCLEAQNRVVFFLTALPRVRYVFLGAASRTETGQDRQDRTAWDGRQPRPGPFRVIRVSTRVRNATYHRHLIHQLSGAFAAGFFRRLKRIDGLFNVQGIRLCTNPLPRVTMNDTNGTRPQEDHPHCAVCHQVMNNLPVELLLHAHGSMLCVPVQKRLQIALQRGGKRAMVSPARLKEIIKFSFALRGRSLHFDPYRLAEFQAMKEMGLEFEIDKQVVLRMLGRIKRMAAGRTVTKFPRKTLQDLKAIGCNLSETEVEEAGFELSEAETVRSNVRGIFEQLMNAFGDIANDVPEDGDDNNNNNNDDENDDDDNDGNQNNNNRPPPAPRNINVDLNVNNGIVQIFGDGGNPNVQVLNIANAVPPLAQLDNDNNVPQPRGPDAPIQEPQLPERRARVRRVVRDRLLAAVVRSAARQAMRQHNGAEDRGWRRPLAVAVRVAIQQPPDANQGEQPENQNAAERGNNGDYEADDEGQQEQQQQQQREEQEPAPEDLDGVDLVGNL